MTRELTYDELLGGRLKMWQPQDGPKVSMDTVLLASWVRVRARHIKFLELGAASGAVSLMLALRFPSVDVTGIEIQGDLVDTAIKNRDINGISERVSFLEGDLRDTSLFPAQSFDGIAVNPPYETKERGRVSPVESRAIARHGADTCSVEDVAKAACRWLKDRGRLFAIFRADRMASFIDAMLACLLVPKRLRMIYPKANKPAKLFLIECVKRADISESARDGLTIEPSLTVYGDGDEYTPELLAEYEKAAGRDAS